MGEFTTTIAGATRRQKEIKKAVKWLDSGAANFHLIAEPENPHDANAIRVEAERKRTFGTERIMLGYLPATVAARIKGRVADLEIVEAYERDPDEEFDFWNIALTIDDPSLERKPSNRAGANRSSDDRREAILILHKLAGGLATIIGLVLILVGVAKVEPGGTIGGVYSFGPSILVLGLIWYFVARVRLWRHKRRMQKT